MPKFAKRIRQKELLSGENSPKFLSAFIKRKARLAFKVALACSLLVFDCAPFTMSSQVPDAKDVSQHGFNSVFKVALAATGPRLHPYSHYSRNEPVSLVLEDFAKAQGYVASISPQISGVISGRFNEVPGNTFMEAMKAAYGVRYYTLGDVMYFYHDSEWSQNILKPSSMSPSGLISALRDAKLESNELPLKVNAQGFIVVNGPQSYVDNLANVAKTLDKSNNQVPVMRVFPLKYAKANDIRIDNMDQSVIVPGVASILERMVSGNTGGNGVSVIRHAAVQKGLLGSGLASSRNAGLNANNGTGIVGIADALDGSLGAKGKEELSHIVSVIADTRLNAVIVQDLPARMPYYEKVIAELDRPTELVELHAAIIDVDADETENLGVNWTGDYKIGNWNLGAGVGNLNSTSDGGGIISTIFETNNSKFLAKLNLLELDKKAKTLGRPSVITMDNVEATLEDTRTIYVPISGYQATDLFKVDSGTVLRVTPHIISETDGTRYIQMVIALQSNQNNNSDNITTVPGEDGRTVIIPPTISQTKINTQAVVREGQSLLIGGYYVEYAQVADHGIPKIKDAPVVGGLFGSNNTNTYQRKRLLLITPRILSLNELNVPDDVNKNDLQFAVTPTQSNYNYLVRDPVEERSGCSSTRNTNSATANTRAQQANLQQAAPHAAVSATALPSALPANAPQISPIPSNKATMTPINLNTAPSVQYAPTVKYQ